MSDFRCKLLKAGDSLDRKEATQCDSLPQSALTNIPTLVSNSNATPSVVGVTQPPSLSMGTWGQNSGPLIQPFTAHFDTMPMRLQKAQEYVSAPRLELNVISERKRELDMEVIHTARSHFQWQTPIPLHCGPSAEVPMLWDNLPTNLVHVVGDYSEFTGFPRIACLLAILTALSTATCGRFKVTVHEGWSESIALYTAIGSPSGTKKSNFLEKIQQPLLDFERNMQVAHALHFDPNRLNAVKKASQKSIMPSCLKS